ncbi:MAG: hypothetical protein GX058_05120 [Firmicutes bacterium]|nr:hypothetical protein [Bacillota bacterium]
MSLPEDELKNPAGEQPDSQPVPKRGRVFGHPARTTAALQSAANSVIKLGNNLNELTAALDNLVKVAEKIRGQSL